ncbi:15464_t:CDS:2, partial [Racocetra fulgida]
MNSVERLVHYSDNIEVEAEDIILNNRPPPGWPAHGESFFRFIEATSGSIVIDDVDISKIGLKDLRSNITIIPQDPVLFNGTISDLELWNALRLVHLIKNSNPTSENEGSDIILPISDQTNHKHEPIMLDSPVKENGSNFSQGQQQLIAMARALVRHSKVIIMDEATA